MTLAITKNTAVAPTIGISFVVGFFVLAWAFFTGCLPIRIFWLAVCAETFLGLWTIGRIKALTIAASIGCLLQLCGPLKAAAEQQPLTHEESNKISLDVVVTPKSGPPVADLQQQDFTLLDNKTPQTITSFRASQGSATPTEVVVVVDAVNMPYEKIPYERQQIDEFLRANGGRLEYPTAIAFFTDTTSRIEDAFLTDGNAISDFLDQYELSLQTIHSTNGFYGALERLQLSIKTLSLLVAREAPRPGRKIILWISPGWPYLADTEGEIDSKQQKDIFANIVHLSTQLREARAILYSIDPLPEGFLLAPLPTGGMSVGRRDRLPSAAAASRTGPAPQGSSIVLSNLL